MGLEFETDRQVARYLSILCVGASLFSMIVGLSAIVGWALNISLLKSWIPGEAPVRFNAAVCFVLLGLALWLLRKEPDGPAPMALVGRIMGAGVGLMGALTLLENLFGWDLHIDQILYIVRPGEEIGSTRPGLIPMVGALSLLMLGAALFFLDWKTRSQTWPSGLLAASVSIFSFVGVLDFALPRELSQTKIALPGTLDILFVSVGVVCARPQWAFGGLLTRPSMGASWLRRTIPAGMAMLALIAWVVSKPLLTSARLTWIETNCMIIGGIVLVLTFFGWTATLLEKSEQERESLEQALNSSRLSPRFSGRPDGPPVEAALRRWSFVGIAIGVFLAILGGYDALRGTDHALEEVNWIVHTNEVRTTVAKVLTDAVDIETGARGFGITGEHSFLGPFLAGEHAIGADLDQLDSLITHSPIQQQRLQLLRIQVDARLRSAESVIAERKQTGTVPQLATLEEGKRRMDAVRAMVHEMDTEEADLLNLRTSEAIAARRQSNSIILVTIFAGVLILLAAALAVRREVLRSAQMRRAIEKLNADLEQRVQDRTEKLGQSERRIRILMDSTAEAILGQDLEGNCTFCNQAAAKLLGYDSPAELIGNNLHRMTHHSKPDGTSLGVGECPIQEAMRAGKDFHTDDITLWRKDRTTFLAECWSHPLLDGGKAVGTVVTFLDITKKMRAEEVLRRSQALLVHAGQMTRLGAWDMDIANRDTTSNVPSSTRLRWSDEVYRIFGYAPGQVEVTHDLFLERTHPDDRQRVLDAVAEAIAAKKTYAIEHRIVRPDGTERIVLEHADVSFNEQGEPVQVSGAVQDITERKRAEGALRRSLERLERVLEIETVGVMFWDLNTGCMVEANDTFLKLMGYSRRDVEARELKWQNLTPPEYMDLSRAEVDKFLVTGRVGPYEKEYFRKDGTRKWLLFAGSSLGNNQCVEFCVDISDRKNAETALQAAHEELSAIYESAPVALLVVADDLCVEKLNDVAGRFTEHDAAFLSELRPGVVLGCLNATDSPHGCGNGPSCEQCGLRLSVMECLSKGVRLNNLEIWLPLRLEGGKEQRCLLVSVAPLEFRATKKALVCVQDITKLRRAESEVRALNLELEQRVKDRTAQLLAANQELESFSYSVSHDLRAPLRFLNSFSRILLEEHAAQMPSDARHYLEVIQQSAIHMGNLVDGLLKLSRLGRQSLEKRQVVTTEIVHQAVELLRPEQEGREVQITIGQLASCEADPLLVRQIFVNLISNGLKYSRTRQVAMIEIGSVKVAELCQRFAPDHSAQSVLRLCRPETPVFYVRDNGVGFDMRYVDKLFGTFQRLHRKEDFEGIGLGLAIVQRIVHKHDGQVWAEGKVDEGATFYFTLHDRRAHIVTETRVAKERTAMSPQAQHSSG